MKQFFLFLAGLAGGVLAGLGMGGGTLTIPLLVLALGVKQIAAQSVNLVSFLPTGTAALLLHIKNGYVEFKEICFLVLPAMVCCLGVSFFAVKIDGAMLKKIFGGFLIAVGVCSLVEKIIQNQKIGYLH